MQRQRERRDPIKLKSKRQLKSERHLGGCKVNEFKHKNDKATVIPKKTFKNIRAKIIPIQHLTADNKNRGLKEIKTDRNIQRESYHMRDSGRKHQIVKSFDRNDTDSTPKKAAKSLSYWHKKEISPFIRTVKGFFQNIMESSEGCRCSQPCKWAALFFDWTGKSQLEANTKYTDMKSRLKNLQKNSNNKQNHTHDYDNIQKSIVQIKKDVKRTHYHHSTFRNQDFIEKGQRILTLYMVEDPQIGYIQGMNTILTGLLYHIKEQGRTYAVFRYLMKEVRSVYLENFKKCYERMEQLKQLIKRNIQDLYQHLVFLDFQLETVLLPWLLSMMTVLVRLDSVHLIYQGFFRGGWKFVNRIILAIFIYHKDEVVDMDDGGDILAFFSVSSQWTQTINWKDVISFSNSIAI